MKYKTAKELGITEQERDALIKVKAFLKSLEQPKVVESRRHHNLAEVETLAKPLFNMNREIARYDCGTACCIGGWMSVYMHGIKLGKKVRVPYETARKIQDYVSSKRFQPLYQLFYPEDDLNYDAITTTQARDQITLFLTTGKVTW